MTVVNPGRTGNVASPTVGTPEAPKATPKVDNDPALNLRVDSSFEANRGVQAQRNNLMGMDTALGADVRAGLGGGISAGQLAAAAQAREARAAQVQALEPNQTLAEVPDFKWVSQFDRRVPGHGNTACLRATEWSARQSGVTVGAAEDRIQVGTKEDKRGRVSRADLAEARRGTDYVDSQLGLGRPVVVGVTDRKTGTNADGMTDHFVTITAKKTDENGKVYYEFRDPGTTKEDRSVGRLDVDARGVLVGNSPYNGAHYDVAMIRTNAN